MGKRLRQAWEGLGKLARAKHPHSLLYLGESQVCGRNILFGQAWAGWERLGQAPADLGKLALASTAIFGEISCVWSKQVLLGKL